MGSALVSIVVPCYNQSQLICDALESIVAQTHRPLEVWVVDDGSTDSSAEVVANWIAHLQDPACVFTLLSQENQGAIAACANGLAHCQGSYTMRLDGDDTLPPDYVAETVHLLANSPKSVGYCYTNAHYFGDRTGTMAVPEFSKQLLLTDNFVHSAALIRTPLLKEYGWFSPTMKSGFEDWDFWLTLLEHGITGIKCSSTYMYYRQTAAASGELSGRNDMQAEKARAMRAQIHKNHPRLFNTPSGALTVLAWKIKRRIGRYLGFNG